MEGAKGFADERDGRWDTQSCTNSETRGLEVRLRVFLVDGWVVMIMMGPGVEEDDDMEVAGSGYGLTGR